MREPAQLVSAILEELRPLRDGVSQDEAKNGVDASLGKVKEQMRVLDRQSVMKNRNSARQIRNTIRRLQYQIRTAPSCPKLRLCRANLSQLRYFERSGNVVLDGEGPRQASHVQCGYGLHQGFVCL